MKQILIAGYSLQEAQQIQEEIYEMLKPCQFSLAFTYDEYLSLIQEFQPDLVILNHKLPDFDGTSVLKTSIEHLPNIPIVLFTEINDIEIAIKCLKAGAADFILNKNIKQLSLSILKAIEQRQKQTAIENEQALLLKSIDRYRQIAELSPFPISIIDLNGRYIYLNPKFTEIFGYHLEDIITGRDWFAKAYPDKAYRDIALSTWLSDLNKSTAYQTRPRVFKVTCKNGTDRDVLFMPITIEGGEQVVIYEDITERKQAEEALQKSEENLKKQNQLITTLILKGDWFYQDLVSNIRRILEICSELIQVERVSIWRYNADYSKIRCIGIYERSNNIHSKGEELVSADFPDYTASHKNGKVIAAPDVFIDPRTKQIPHEYFLKHGISSLLDAPIYVGGCLAGLLSFEHVGEKRNWSSIDERLSLAMATHVSLCFEIDERKRIEKELHDSKIFYQTIFEGSSEGFFIMTDTFIECNESACNILGCSKEDIIGHSPIEFSPEFQPDGRTSDNAAKEYIDAALLRKPQRFYWKHKRKDGSLIDTEISLSALNVDKRTLLFATMVNISERRQAEEALRQAEEKYRNIFENAMEGIFQTTKEGHILTANPALARMYGYDSPEEFIKDITYIGKQIYDDPRRRDDFIQILEKEGFVSNFEIKSRRKDGTTFWASVNAKIIRDTEGEIEFYEGMIEDITERKKLEEQLRQSHKMEAVGALAGGIAHDFNNILTAILGYAHLTLMKLNDDNPLCPYLNQIVLAVDKASSLTNSLLAFSRKQMISIIPIKLNDVIKDLEKMLQRIIGEDIELKTFLSEEDLIIIADYSQLEQVVLNLAVNARDAMPDGGLLIIETEKIEIDEEYAKTHGYGKPGAYALLTITDFGTGIDKDILDKIFEPFFTTKGRDKGTGLGLSMVYGIVKQHNGYINCYSEIGKGTIFKIYLPLTQQKTISAKPSTPITTNIVGAETILLAEDDENVRKLTKYVLEKYGYRVIEAVDGENAIEKFKENQPDIDLLLFDVIMPKMNGKIAYEEIKKMQADIKVIFLSGYTANVIHKKGILEEGINLVLKPVPPIKLLNKIRQVLSS